MSLNISVDIDIILQLFGKQLLHFVDTDRDGTGNAFIEVTINR